MKAVEAFALISGKVSQELLLRNEYLAAENEILRSRLGKRVALTRSERVRLAKLGKNLGKRALQGVSTIVKPESGMDLFLFDYVLPWRLTWALDVASRYANIMLSLGVWH